MQRLSVLVLLGLALGAGGAPLQSQPATASPGAPVHAFAVRRFLVRDVMVVYGAGKPPFGPMDVVIDDGLIAEVRSSADDERPQADVVIDGRGK